MTSKPNPLVCAACGKSDPSIAPFPVGLRMLPVCNTCIRKHGKNIQWLPNVLGPLLIGSAKNISARQKRERQLTRRIRLPSGLKIEVEISAHPEHGVVGHRFLSLDDEVYSQPARIERAGGNPKKKKATSGPELDSKDALALQEWMDWFAAHV